MSEHVTKPEAPAPGQQPQVRISTMVPTGRGSWVTVLDDVEIPTTIVEQFDLRAGRTLTLVPATAAPSQPAREFVHSIEYDSPWWGAKMSLIGKMPSRVFDDVCALMEAFAAQQSAAKEAELQSAWQSAEIARAERAGEQSRAEAAERERDSLRDARDRARFERDDIAAKSAAEIAALKAGKDGQ